MSTTHLDSLEELDAYYAGIADHYDRNADYVPLLKDIMAKLETLHGQFFQSEAGPSREGWPALADSTIRRKGHDTILYETGRLRRSLESETSDSIREIVDQGLNHGLTFGTSVPYSIYHMPGGSGLKTREHVGIGQAEFDAIAEAVAARTLEIIMEA